MRVVSGQTLRVENHHVTWTVIGVVVLLGADVIAHTAGPYDTPTRLPGVLVALGAVAVTLTPHTRVRRRRWAVIAVERAYGFTGRKRVRGPGGCADMSGW